MEQTKKVMCSNEKCKYKWETTSKLLYVTCPCCQRKIKNEPREEIYFEGKVK